MTPTEANALANTIATSWPTRGVSTETWAARLEPLAYGPALETVVRLVDTAEHAPSVAQFLAAHRATNAPNVERWKTPCTICDGTGWEQIEVHRAGHPEPTTGVTPCRCSNGKDMDEPHRRAVEHNDRELRHGQAAREVAAA